MKYGSFHNNHYARATKGQPTPVVGMGATILLWSDRHAATIVSVGGKPDAWVIEVQEDRAKVISGSDFDGSADYEYSPRPNGRIHTFRFKDGVWRELDREGRLMPKGSGSGLRIGDRLEYRDPSF